MENLSVSKSKNNTILSSIDIVNKIIEVCDQSKSTIKKIHQKINIDNPDNLSKKMNLEIKNKLSNLYKQLNRSSEKLKEILLKYKNIKTPEDELKIMSRIKKEMAKFKSTNSPIKKFNDFVNNNNTISNKDV